MRTFDDDGSPNNFMSKQHGSIFEDDDDFDVNEEKEEIENEEIEDKNNEDNEDDEIEDKPTENEEENEEDDYISQILKSKGIEDINSIKYEDENGEVIEVSWNDLPDEDKINILTQSEQEVSEEDDLSEEEVELLNFMRQNNFSKKDLETYYKNEALKEIEDNSSYSYSSDDYSDDELIYSRYKELFPKMSDEMIIERMQKEKEENEELYNENANEIRGHYRSIEEEMLKQSELDEIERQKQELEDFKDNIVNASSEISHIDELELEPKDKEDVISYILDQDANGASRFAKDLNDPKKLFLAAWFLAKGDEAFKTLTDYYKSEIDKSRKQPSVKPQVKQSKTQVVVKSSHSKTNKQSTSLHDLYEDI